MGVAESAGFECDKKQICLLQRVPFNQNWAKLEMSIECAKQVHQNVPFRHASIKLLPLLV
jgi:hypothetical protein